MRAKEFAKKDQQVDEILPALGAIAGGIGRAALSGVGAVARGAMAAGRAVTSGINTIGNAATTVGNVANAATAAKQAVGMTDPQAAAVQQQQRKDLEAEVRQGEQQLLALKQQLAKLK